MNKDLTLHYQKLAYIRRQKIEILIDEVNLNLSYDTPNSERLKDLELQENEILIVIKELEN